eukprot:scaffold370_cov349-Pavlova_lutheri.AAC.37
MGPPVGPRRAMPIPAVFDTDEDGSWFTQRSSAVDDAAIVWGYSPLILACNTQLRRWQLTNVSKVNTLLLTDSELDKSFWNFAVEYSSFVRNRLPCRPHSKTRFEIVLGHRSDLSKMQIFGQRCSVLKNTTEMEGYCDANYENCEEARRSTTGYVFRFHGSLIAWQTKLQKPAAAFTTGTEYMALTNAAKEALYFRKILKDIGYGVQCINVYCDNQGIVNRTKNAFTVSRNKHTDIMYHFVRNGINRGELDFKYIHTKNQLADFLIKSLEPSKLQSILQKVGLIM